MAKKKQVREVLIQTPEHDKPWCVSAVIDELLKINGLNSIEYQNPKAINTILKFV